MGICRRAWKPEASRHCVGLMNIPRRSPKQHFTNNQGRLQAAQSAKHRLYHDERKSRISLHRQISGDKIGSETRRLSYENEYLREFPWQMRRGLPLLREASRGKGWDDDDARAIAQPEQCRP